VSAAARLLRLEQFLERYDAGQDQRDFAHQQRLAGHQGDDLQRHRAHDAGGHHTGHHHGLLYGLVLLLATTCSTQTVTINTRLIVIMYCIIIISTTITSLGPKCIFYSV